MAGIVELAYPLDVLYSVISTFHFSYSRLQPFGSASLIWTIGCNPWVSPASIFWSALSGSNGRSWQINK